MKTMAAKAKVPKRANEIDKNIDHHKKIYKPQPKLVLTMSDL